jgi:acylphosphatase
MTKRNVRLRITGRVQGVWYRGWTVETATALGLSGWVRNRSDGSVEAVASGEAADIEKLIAACHRGPPSARVAEVKVTDAHEIPAPGFRQASTL